MTTVVPSSRVTHLADVYHRAEMSNGTSVPSNWRLSSTGSNFGIVWSPESASAAAISYGSNATDVSSVASGGGSETAVSRAGHVHKGVHRITGAGSNGLFGDIDIVGQGSVGVTFNGQTIQISGPGSTGGGGVAASALLQAVYGPGSDGDVTIAAGTTSLTRDMYYNNLTVTGTLDTNGWRVFVKDTISGAGTVSNTPGNGGNGGNGTGAAGGGAGAAGGTTSGNNVGPGASGTAGRIGGFNAVGLNGTNGQQSQMLRPDGSSINHSIGGAGGAGANAGGSGAAATTGVNTADPKPVAYPLCCDWRDQFGNAFVMNGLSGKASGSGSGGGSATGGGGGSGGTGGGGGPIMLAAKTWTGTFTVQSKGGGGGNGGNGFATSGNNGGGAGGNGGAGGIIVAIYASRAGWSGSLDVSGGAGGTHGNGNGGGANGADGVSGPAGHKLEYQMG